MDFKTRNASIKKFRVFNKGTYSVLKMRVKVHKAKSHIKY